jgi:alkanesulfonate monooxygenase SsuD/methylene tetrahydromethanopterin reductase-like flavin-dependent oxidoreductase (luciferase family)
MFSIKSCGLMFEPQQGMCVDELANWAKYAEKSGYGYFFRSDHLLPTSGEKKGVDSPECWTTLGAVSALTRRIKFGPLVSPVGFRNPALLARMACTLDSFSKGRMMLAVGAGWNEDEYKAHGMPFYEFRTRRKQFLDSLEIIRPITEGKRVDYDGEFFSAHVECFPKPHGSKMHLICGGRNRKVVETLAKYADEWNLFSTPVEKYQQLRNVLEASRERSGINEKIEVSLMSSFIIGESKRELSRRIKNYAWARALGSDPEVIRETLVSKGVLCGLVEDFVAQVSELREVGIEKFYFQCLDTKDREMIGLLTSTLKSEF